MNLDVSDFLDSRIEEIVRNLRETNSEYALAAEKNKELIMHIDPIIHHEDPITISAEDCMDFREFFENDFTCAAILQSELYRQGYRDCVELFGMLGIL